MVDTKITSTPPPTRTRAQILTFLATKGPIVDPSGHANRKLRDSLGFDGSTGAFTQMLAAMDQAGLVQRTIKGRRTYSIQLGPAAQNFADAEPREAAPPQAAPPQAVPGTAVERAEPQSKQFDYDEMAAAVLRSLGRLLTAAPAATQVIPERSVTPSASQRRIVNLERTVTALEKDLARTRAERNEALERTAQLQQRLESAEKNVELLRERSRPRRAQPRAQLDEEEAMILRRLSQRGETRPPSTGAPPSVPGWPRP